MRELKFRVWSEDDKEYRTDCKLKYLFTSPTGLPSTVYNDEGDRFDIEQYTGLKDKNGKEIYVGDIIHRGALPKVNVFRNSVIRFDEESVGFIATSTRNGARTLFNGHTCDEIEVIGNIHENYELLDGEL